MSSDAPTNPFQSPKSDFLADATGVEVDFVPIMRRWDRLRLVYNGVLVTEVLGVAFFLRPNVLWDVGFFPVMCIAGVIANICFTTGPAIEAYGTYYGIWHPILTLGLFLAGLGGSMMLAFGTVMGL
ncbi:MAG: hypothetical protein AAFU85_16035 [Planctomycetota bacterium]